MILCARLHPIFSIRFATTILASCPMMSEVHGGRRQAMHERCVRIEGSRNILLSHSLMQNHSQTTSVASSRSSSRSLPVASSPRESFQCVRWSAMRKCQIFLLSSLVLSNLVSPLSQRQACEDAASDIFEMRHPESELGARCQ